MKKLKKILLIILAIVFVVQLYMFFCVKWSQQHTDYDLYKNTKSMQLDTLELGCFSFSVPSDWMNKCINHEDLIEEIKKHYMENDSVEDYDFHDKYILSKTDDSIQIIKQDDFYVNVKLYHYDSVFLSLGLAPNILEDNLASRDFDMDGVEIIKTIGSYYGGETVPDNEPEFQLCSVKDSKFESKGNNGYIMIMIDRAKQQAAVMSVSMSDEYYERYIMLDRIIIDSLKCEGG